jgi:hypothetical protein
MDGLCFTRDPPAPPSGTLFGFFSPSFSGRLCRWRFSYSQPLFSGGT